jgi:cell division septation protein DedD
VISGPVARCELPSVLPRLLHDATLAVLTPGGDPAWAAAMGWEIARTLARSGRRTALIDLHVRQPLLDPQRRGEATPGIADALRQNLPMHRVVRRTDVPGLYFIPAGTPPPDPEEVWGHARWARLARGFAHEQALLLLFLPEEACARLPLRPDHVIVLGGPPRPAGAAVPGLDPAIPTTRVIPDPPPLRVQSASPPARFPRSTEPPRAHPPSWPWLAAAAGVVALLAVLELVAGGNRAAGDLAAGGDAGESAPTAPPPEAPAAPQAPAPPAPPTPPGGGDSLYYAVQVASFKTQDRAVEHAGTYARAGWPATVSPVRLGLQGVWYRVLVGAFPHPAAADSGLRRFHALGLLERTHGTILRTPHAFLVSTTPDRAAAVEQAAGLRDALLPAYIVVAPGPLHRVVVGAFETPEQAVLMDSMLTTAGIAARLVSRAGIAP